MISPYRVHLLGAFTPVEAGGSAGGSCGQAGQRAEPPPTPWRITGIWTPQAELCKANTRRRWGLQPV